MGVRRWGRIGDGCKEKEGSCTKQVGKEKQAEILTSGSIAMNSGTKKKEPQNGPKDEATERGPKVTN